MGAKIIAAASRVASIASALQCRNCASPFVAPHTFPCGHTFCQTCAETSVNESDGCSACGLPFHIHNARADHVLGSLVTISAELTSAVDSLGRSASAEAALSERRAAILARLDAMTRRAPPHVSVPPTAARTESLASPVIATVSAAPRPTEPAPVPAGPVLSPVVEAAIERSEGYSVAVDSIAVRGMAEGGGGDGGAAALETVSAVGGDAAAAAAETVTNSVPRSRKRRNTLTPRDALPEVSRELDEVRLRAHGDSLSAAKRLCRDTVGVDLSEAAPFPIPQSGGDDISEGPFPIPVVGGGGLSEANPFQTTVVSRDSSLKAIDAVEDVGADAAGVREDTKSHLTAGDGGEGGAAGATVEAGAGADALVNVDVMAELPTALTSVAPEARADPVGAAAGSLLPRAARSHALVLCGTALTDSARRTLKRVVRLLKAREAESFDPSVTHVITRVLPDAQPLTCRRTLKFVQGVLAGAWVLSSDWLDACISAGTRAPEASFEITGTTQHEGSNAPRRSREAALAGARPLLAGLRFRIGGKLLRDMSAAEAAELVTAAGGAVAAEELTAPTYDASTVALVSLAARSWPSAADRDGLVSEALRNGVRVIDQSFLLDCASLFELRPFGLYTTDPDL